MPRLSVDCSFVSALLLGLSACDEEERASPDQTYLEYYSKVIGGRTFEEDLAYHSKARREEVLDQMAARAEGS